MYKFVGYTYFLSSKDSPPKPLVLQLLPERLVGSSLPIPQLLRDDQVFAKLQLGKLQSFRLKNIKV